MNALGSTLLGLVFGLGSAVIPLLNAEAYAVASAAGTPALVVPIVLALTIGQTAGKVVLFEAARRGSTRLQSSPKVQAMSSNRWAERTQEALQAPRTALPLVFASAGLGLPPLALVRVAAGAAGQSRKGFVVMCLLGRGIRFSALATPVVLAATRW